MRVRTSNLSGTALDWAVADIVGDTEKPNFVIYKHHPTIPAEPCLRQAFDPEGPAGYFNIKTDFAMWETLRYSTDPSLAWPIIEREDVQINTLTAPTEEGQHVATIRFMGQTNGIGPTKLIAVMRCLVRRYRGDEVEVPDELMV